MNWSTKTVASVLLVSLMASSARANSAATVEVVERSIPAGIVSRNSTVGTPSEHLTLTAPLTQAGYRFTHWVINGVRHNDVTGRAKNPVRIAVFEAIDAVAHYRPESDDSNGDGVPDWYKIHFYGTLNIAADSDTDGDGLTLAEEFRYDLHPNIPDSFISGGISMRSSDSILMLLNPDFFIYTEQSNPGGFVSRTVVASNGTEIVSSNLGPASQGYSFAYWMVDGVRQADALGMALSQFRVSITNHTTAVALYLPTGQDSVGDGIADWWRLRHFGHLEVAAGTDVSGDGLSLADAWRYDLNPLISNSFVSGGVSMRNSEPTLVNLAGFYSWSIASNPAGLITPQSGVAPTGTVITTASLGNPVSGYSFGYWSLNGQRQADALGVALSQVRFAVETNMQAVAHYFTSDADVDGNGLADWWEQRYFGATGLNPDMDVTGDGLSLADAWRYDFNPLISNSFIVGGISMRSSERVTVNLQPFERVQHILLDGVLNAWFTIWPRETLGNADFGSATTPALGDWDGDGDPDLFVVLENGSLHIWENTGSAYTPDLAERPAVAAALGVHLLGLVNPHISLVDFSGNGSADLIASGEGGKVRIISSTGNFGSEQFPSVSYELELGEEAGRVMTTVMEMDGVKTLLALREDGFMDAYTHSGNDLRPFDLPARTNDVLGVLVPSATGLAVADITRSGETDLLISDESGRIWEFWRQPDGTLRLMSRVWAGSAPGFADRMVVSAADLDGDGDVDAFIGFEQGGIMFLRDPRLGPPSNLRAVGGASSVALSWRPDRQTRVRGYVVYRANHPEGSFERLHADLLNQPFFTDASVTNGQTYFYYVKSATLAYFPGSTVGALRESPPSDVVSATAGTVRLWMSDYSAGVGQDATLMINVDRAEGIRGAGLQISVTYDATILTPISQIDAEEVTVRRTAITEQLVYSDNAPTANGILTINGISGQIIGAGSLFNVVFRVNPEATPLSSSINEFSMASLFAVGGASLAVDSSDTATFTVSSNYMLGDVNGDGVVDMEDHHLLVWLLQRNTREPTELEIRAGDMNGDGVLSQRDIPLLLRLIHGKDITP
jgi:hypothetical protein